MSNYSDLFPTGSTGKILVGRKIFYSSGTFEIPAGCFYDILAFGSGGSGAAAAGTDRSATGGGGAAWCRDWGIAEVDNTLTIVIGAGGNGAIATPSSVVNGNNGGNTTVTGTTGVNITILGGQAGSAATTGPIAGGAGGTVLPTSQVRYRVNGSSGGNILAPGTGLKSTGGGSPNLFAGNANNACSGGDITNTVNGYQATGGGGVGGGGGHNPSTSSFTAGGGAGGAATNGPSSIPGPNVLGVTTANTVPDPYLVLDILLSFPSINPTSSGTDNNSIASSGGGSSGIYNGTSINGAIFGGSGGKNYASGSTTGGAVTYCGGSGGVVCQTGTATSGRGGNGLVIVSLYKEQV